ncbi:MAG TPA: type II secretion system protein [bacterium]|nr:type II secretion system protein [bacterium]
MGKFARRGFTLIELLVVIVIIGILAALALPNFVKAREKAKEAEVKSNLRSVQIALERYAVDSGGVYPLTLYGGDYFDTFTTTRTPAPNPDPSGIAANDPDGLGRSEFRNDVDTLIQYSYLSQYPRNPFTKRRDVNKYGRFLTNPAENLSDDPNAGHFMYDGNGNARPRVNIWSQGGVNGNADRSQQLVRRQVGGEKGDLMWDISEGQRHIPFPIVVVPNDGRNPVLGTGEAIAVSSTNFRDDHQFWISPGNFYYYATFSGIGSYSSFVEDENGINYNAPIMGTVTGWNLAGYGTVLNPGQDVYNIQGDYPERSLNTRNQGGDGSTTADLDVFYVGPDGRRDGVILVLKSGSDRKAAINQDDTGRDFNANP